MAKRGYVTLAVLGFLMICRAAGATGLLLPEDKALPPLGIKSHRVAASVKDGVATTKLTEVFFNSTKQRLEATYVFPIPKEAALTDFAMYVNGKRQSGQVVEASKARGIYEDIVRRARDPGLLEYMDSNLLKMRVFPIEPGSTQTIEVSYAYALPFDSGVYRYTFPLQTGERASAVLEDSTFSVEISSKLPITNVYSPTHKVGVSKKSDRSVVVGFEEEKALLNKDFVLFYTVSEKDFGLNLITFRRKGEDGYFALMLAPRLEIKEDEVMPKDVCFVLDVSGSMQEQNRIASAKAAVKFCLKSLNARDRFALVPFSTGTEAFGEGLTDASKENIEKALAYVEKLEARGGTALCAAMLKGLEMASQGDRPYIVTLITDGKPTVGIVEPDKIIEEVKKANKQNIRVFCFGIAEQLDVPLLDKIAEATGGYSEYVSPGREIEAEISGFFKKVSHPVLTNLKLAFGAVKVSDMYPQQLPDLFRGSQVLAFGRYSGSGDVAVELTGMVKGNEHESAYDASFPEAASDNEFIPHLWAQRKIGYLLDEIRLHGESKELKDEVVRLSKEFGIATPYTSYLVLENEKAYRDAGIAMSIPAIKKVYEQAVPYADVNGAPALQEREKAARRLDATRGAMESVRYGGHDGGYKSAGEEAGGYGVGGVGPGTGPAGAPTDVELSKAMRFMKEGQTITGESGLVDMRATLTKVGDKTFVKFRGYWVDTALKEGMETVKVKWGSDAYFALLRAMPELKKPLALGENVIVVIGKKALIIGAEGKESLSEEEVREFTKK